MKKLFCICIAFILMMSALVSFSACGKEDSFTLDEEGNVDMTKPVLLRFAAPEGQFGEEIEAFKAGFKKLYPKVTIKYEPLAGDWSSKLLGQLNSGTAPDIFWTNAVYQFASRGALEPLEPYYEENNFHTEDYHETMFKGGQFDGVQYMMPREYNHVVIYYNKTMFDNVFASYNEADLPFTPMEGTKYPANGWTWEEFIETAKCFVADDGKGNFTARGADIAFAWDSSGPTIFEGLGGTLRTEQDGKEGIDFNNEGNLRILEQIKKYTQDGVFVNATKNDVGDIFSGRVAMMVNARPAASTFENKFGSDWDVVSFPKLPVKAIVGSGSSGYVLNKQSKVKSVAAKLLFYMVSEEGQEVFMKTGNCVPVKKSLLDSDVWRSNPRKDINHDAFTYAPENDKLAYRYSFKSDIAMGKFDEAWIKFATALFNGDYSVSDAMAYGQTEFEKIFTK